ncbi:MAG: alpha/beta hydrolase [Pseudomonadota bacterium]
MTDFIADRHFSASDGRKIAFCDTGGDGPPVLCLAGLTRDSRDFEPLMLHLVPDYRMISMDYRGRGQSGWAEDAVAEYQLEREGTDAVELLDHLGLEAATVLGTSRGGLIGMGLAANLPGRVRALILNDIGPVLDVGGIEFILAYLGRPLEFPDFDAAAAMLTSLYGPSAPDMTHDDWLAYARRSFFEGEDGRPALSYDPKLRDAVEASLTDAPPDIWPLFESITCPVLALRGANSNILTEETFAEMQTRKPAMAAVAVPDRGHCPLLDEPVSLDALRGFLGGLS